MKHSLFKPLGLSLVLVLTLFFVISCSQGEAEKKEPLSAPTETTVIDTSENAETTEEESTAASVEEAEAPAEDGEEAVEAVSQPVSPLADGRSESPLQLPESAPVESALLNDAVTAVEMGEYNLARERLDQAIADGESLVRAYTLRGSLSFEQLRFLEAEQDYTSALAIEPTLDTLVRRCHINMMLERQEQAIQDCQAAIAMDPTSPEPHARLAWVYLERNHNVQKDETEESGEAEDVAKDDTSADDAEGSDLERDSDADDTESDTESNTDTESDEIEAAEMAEPAQMSDKELARISIDQALALIPDEIDPAMSENMANIFYIAGLIGLNEGSGNEPIDEASMTDDEIADEKERRSEANELRLQGVLDNLTKCTELHFEPRCLWERGFIYYGLADVEKSIADMETIIEEGNPIRHGIYIFRAGTQLQVLRGNDDGSSK